jgi:hypothetical protein
MPSLRSIRILATEPPRLQSNEYGHLPRPGAPVTPHFTVTYFRPALLHRSSWSHRVFIKTSLSRSLEETLYHSFGPFR